MEMELDTEYDPIPSEIVFELVCNLNKSGDGVKIGYSIRERGCNVIGLADDGIETKSGDGD